LESNQSVTTWNLGQGEEETEEMIYPTKTASISGGLVACMLTVAYAEFYQGKAPGEVHLITPAPLAASALATGSIGSTVAFNGAISHIDGSIEHYNTIIDADYCPTPDSRPLRHDGLIWLSEATGRGGGPPRDAS
jgi:hypothetical protein